MKRDRGGKRGHNRGSDSYQQSAKDTKAESRQEKREQGYKTTERNKGTRRGGGSTQERGPGHRGRVQGSGVAGPCRSCEPSAEKQSRAVRSTEGQGQTGASQGAWDGG